MANYDLGLAKCYAKERAEGAIAEYVSYGKLHYVDIFDETTEIGKNFYELWNMDTDINKCTTEEEINKYLERIAELKADLAALLENEQDCLPYIQRYIWISGEGFIHRYLGMGITDILRLYNLAKNGEIENAESIKVDWGCNCDIVFKGINLLRFLQEYYPDYLSKYKPEINIISDALYTVSGVDLS